VKHWIAITGCIVVLTASLCGHLVFGQEPYSGYPYVPAMYRIDGHFLLFPLTGKGETEVSLPIRTGLYHVSPDGKALYTAAEAKPVLRRHMPGLFKIEFHPTRVSSVPGSGDFRAFASIAISLRQEDAVVAGKYWNGTKVVCGVFDLNLLDGSVRQVLDTQDCDDALSRTDISLSPDSKHAVAIHKRSVEIIDMATGKFRNIGDGFQAAAWSPDGRWIAAARYSSLQARMVLFDPAAFTPRKTLASSTVFRVSWSPDSRFLLAWKLLAGCGPDEYSYEMFDVETGKSSTIESSRCKIWGNDVGWVDRTIATQ